MSPILANPIFINHEAEIEDGSWNVRSVWNRPFFTINGGSNIRHVHYRSDENTTIASSVLFTSGTVETSLYDYDYCYDDYYHYHYHYYYYYYDDDY